MILLKTIRKSWYFAGSKSAVAAAASLVLGTFLLLCVYPGAFSRVRETDPDYVIPGGESRRQFHARVVAGFEALAQAHAGETVVVVTHGGVLATLYRHIHAIPLDKAHAIPITNASYNALAFDGARWTVDTWSCTLHLPGAEPFEED